MTSRQRTRLTGKASGKGRGRSPPPTPTPSRHQSGRDTDSKVAGWAAGGGERISTLRWGHRPQKARVILGSGASAEGKAPVGRRHLHFSQFSPVVTHHWLG